MNESESLNEDGGDKELNKLQARVMYYRRVRKKNKFKNENEGGWRLRIKESKQIKGIFRLEGLIKVLKSSSKINVDKEFTAEFRERMTHGAWKLAKQLSEEGKSFYGKNEIVTSELLKKKGFVFRNSHQKDDFYSRFINATDISIVGSLAWTDNTYTKYEFKKFLAEILPSRLPILLNNENNPAEAVSVNIKKFENIMTKTLIASVLFTEAICILREQVPQNSESGTDLNAKEM